MTKNVERAARRMDGPVKAWMKAHEIPGMCLSVTDAKSTIRAATYGSSDIAAKRPVRNQTLFQIGSISKSFTSICALQLAEEGLLDLRRPVKDYIPWFEVRSRFGPITLHHLMTHSAGIVVGTESLIHSIPEVYALRDTDTSAPPGEHFHYSNVGYKTVGLVVESVTGKSIADVVRERVVEPLGMKSTTTTINNDVRDRLAVGYADLRDDRPRPLRDGLAPATWGESDTGDGSICSTGEDMARYMRMLLNRGKGPKGVSVLSEGMFSLLTGKHVKDENNEYYGYGFWSADVDGHLHIQHTGGMVGFHSSLVVDMDMGIGVFASVNGPGEPAKATKAVLAAIRASMEGRKNLPPEAALPDPYAVRDAKAYAGEFVCGDRTIEFTATRNSLSLAVGKGKVRMDLRGPDEFYAGSPGHDRFLFRFVKSAGMVTEVAHGPEVYRRAGATAVTEGGRPKEWDAFIGHYRSYNPWLSNFRIVPRGAGLAVIYPWGVEEPLTHLGGSKFKAGADPLNPETICFELFIGGKAQVARISWGVYTRTFTP